MAQEQAEKPKGLFAGIFGAVVDGVGAVVNGVGKVRCSSVFRVAVSCRQVSDHVRAPLNPKPRSERMSQQSKIQTFQKMMSPLS